MKKFDYKKWVVKNKHGNTNKKLLKEDLIGPKPKHIQEWLDRFWSACDCPPPYAPCMCLGSTVPSGAPTEITEPIWNKIKTLELDEAKDYIDRTIGNADIEKRGAVGRGAAANCTEECPNGVGFTGGAACPPCLSDLDLGQKIAACTSGTGASEEICSQGLRTGEIPPSAAGKVKFWFCCALGLDCCIPIKKTKDIWGLEENKKLNKMVNKKLQLKEWKENVKKEKLKVKVKNILKKQLSEQGVFEKHVGSNWKNKLMRNFELLSGQISSPELAKSFFSRMQSVDELFGWYNSTVLPFKTSGAYPSLPSAEEFQQQVKALELNSKPGMDRQITERQMLNELWWILAGLVVVGGISIWALIRTFNDCDHPPCTGMVTTGSGTGTGTGMDLNSDSWEKR